MKTLKKINKKEFWKFKRKVLNYGIHNEKV